MEKPAQETASAAIQKETTLSSPTGSVAQHSSRASAENTGALQQPPPSQSPPQPPPASEGDDGSHVKVDKNTLLIVLSLCVCVFLSALDQTIITTAVPVIAGEFDSPTAYTWIGSSYLLASAAFMPSWGKFSDIWGRKPVLLSAAALFMIGSVLCAASNGIVLMLIGRTIQGLGAGGQLGLVNVTISDIVTVRQRGLYLSYVGMTWATASVIGPVLGGVFTGMADWGWRFCFIVNIPVGFTAILGLCLFLHLESPTIGLVEGLKRVDWFGTIFIVVGVVLFLVGLEFGGIDHPWGSPIIVCFLTFGVAFIIGFIIIEWKCAKFPIMPLRLFNHRTNACSYLVGFCHGFVFISGCYFLPLYFQAVRNSTPLLSGVYVLPYVLSLSCCSGAVGIVISRTGRYQETIWAAVCLMALGQGLLVLFNRTTGWAELAIFQLIAGIGSGPLFQAPLIAIHSTIDPQDLATATAAFSFVRTLGTSLAVSLGLVVFQNGMAHQADDPILLRRLGTEATRRITGGSASASIDYIKTLGPAQRRVAEDAYAQGMRGMWWFFMAVAVVAVVCSIGIGRHHLSKQLSSSQPAVARPKRAKENKEDV